MSEKKFVDKNYLDGFWKDRVKMVPKKVTYEPTTTKVGSGSNEVTLKNYDGFDTENQTLIGAINELTHLGQRTDFTKQKNEHVFEPTVSLGGIKVGDKFDNAKITEILTKMLCPYVYEGAPSIKLNTSGTTSVTKPFLPTNYSTITFSVSPTDITMKKHEFEKFSLVVSDNSGTDNTTKKLYDKESNTLDAQIGTETNKLTYTYYWDYNIEGLSAKATLTYGAITDGTAEDQKNYPGSTKTSSFRGTSISDPDWIVLMMDKRADHEDYWNAETKQPTEALTNLVTNLYTNLSSTTHGSGSVTGLKTSRTFTYPITTTQGTKLYPWIITPKGGEKFTKMSDSMGNLYTPGTTDESFDINRKSTCTITSNQTYNLPDGTTRAVTWTTDFEIYSPIEIVQQVGSEVTLAVCEIE